MPTKKRTKEEQEDEWRKAALELNRLGLLESKHPAFREAYRKKILKKEDEYGWYQDAALEFHADAMYEIICGVGSTAKLRTRFMDCMMPIPDLSFTNYSRMSKRENAGGFWLALGFDKIINDHSYYTDAVKQAPNQDMYLQLPGMTMPKGEGARKHMHPYTEALRAYFHDSFYEGCEKSTLVAVKCRLYMRKWDKFGRNIGGWSSRAAMIDALTGIKDKIEEVEALRAELCELSNELQVILKNNLQAFDVEADNDSGSDSDEEEALASRSKKQKTTCKHENVQKIHISTIEVVKGKGLNDPRDARRNLGLIFGRPRDDERDAVTGGQLNASEASVGDHDRSPRQQRTVGKVACDPHVGGQSPLWQEIGEALDVPTSGRGDDGDGFVRERTNSRGHKALEVEVVDRSLGDVHDRTLTHLIPPVRQLGAAAGRWERSEKLDAIGEFAARILQTGKGQLEDPIV